jgi:hypothetical protein
MQKERIASFSYLKIFIVIVIIAILGSIIYRVSTQFLNSSFHGNSFSILYVAKDSVILTVNNQDKTFSFIKLGDIRNIVKGKNTFESSIAIGFPINAVVIEKDSPGPYNIDNFLNVQNEMRLVFGKNDENLKNLNHYDLYKFINSARSTPIENRTQTRINVLDPKSFKQLIDENIFQDKTIRDMPITIGILNGTSVNGLGNDVAYVLGLKGFNVISVQSANSKSTSSFIATKIEDQKSINTVKNITHMSVKKEKIMSAVDLTIFLGNDIGASFSE